MQVVCGGYKDCSHRDKCYHSKPHDITYDLKSNSVFLNCTINDGSKYIECVCSVCNVRKYKLENIIKIL